MKQNTKAFSLIELMAVIAIIGIMSSVLFVSLSSGRTEKHLENASRQLATDIRSLQRTVLNGAVPPGITEPICGFGMRKWMDDYRFFVIIKSDADTRTGTGCNGAAYGRSTASGNPVTLRDIKSFENGVVLSGTLPDLYFEVPNGKLYVGGAQNASAEYILEKDGIEYHVCVSSGGNVEEMGETSC